MKYQCDLMDVSREAEQRGIAIGEKRSAIETMRELGIPDIEIIERVSRKYSMATEDVKKIMEELV